MQVTDEVSYQIRDAQNDHARNVAQSELRPKLVQKNTDQVQSRRKSKRAHGERVAAHHILRCPGVELFRITIHCQLNLLQDARRRDKCSTDSAEDGEGERQVPHRHADLIRHSSVLRVLCGAVCEHVVEESQLSDNERCLENTL